MVSEDQWVSVKGVKSFCLVSFFCVYERVVVRLEVAAGLRVRLPLLRIGGSHKVIDACWLENAGACCRKLRRCCCKRSRS